MGSVLIAQFLMYRPGKEELKTNINGDRKKERKKREEWDGKRRLKRK